VLVLKGGTALNLMFGSPARLSVDLDFNYVGHEDRREMQANRPDVEHAIVTIAKGQKYRVQQSRDAHAGRKIYLAYINSTGTQDRIEVDLNFLFRLPVGAPKTVPLWQPPGIRRPEIRVVSPEELVTGKLRATLDRAMPRDLFDTIRLPVFGADIWNTEKFRRIHVALAATLVHPLFNYGRDRLDLVSERAIDEQLAPMLPSDQRPQAKELREKAWSVLKPLVTLENEEREYIERIHIGELLPELLFPNDDEMADSLRRHPALRWKIENVRRHLGQ
jgi:predicted nucleotidyltransferase component of viral defense system